MTIEGIAKVCHETNRAYCQVLGDDSQVPWADAPEWQRNSAVAGVKFHVDNPDVGPAGSHNSWLDVKRREGWTFGPVKNVETKQHPCFVPYEALSESQQAKDKLFVSIVHSLKHLLK